MDPERLRRFMRELGRRSTGPGTVYLTGGASALLVGWRSSTIDIDVKLDPEPSGAFEAIGQLKNELDVNVELASPDQFIPVPSDWRSRSAFVERHGEVDFRHFDFRAQALSKLARGLERDLADAREMIARGLVTREELDAAFERITPDLLRYPHLDADTLRERVARFLESLDA